MAGEAVQRRLAAILAADVVGYSRLMAADEERTLARLISVRSEVIDPCIAKHNGRIVKLMGDGALVEFASVVDAVRCAVEIQRGMAKREIDLPDNQRLHFRIGINLGDVVIKGDDIYGDGVNVASRLESIARPCGICLSRQAFDQVEGKILDLKCENLGPKQLKNIDRRVEVFRVVLDGSQDPARHVEEGGTLRRKIALAGILVVIIIAAIVGMWRPWQPALVAASTERMAYPLPEKPSIAVLPFVNMSSDPEQNYFVDGLTEDLIIDLSKVPELFVIARNTAFSYKGELPPAWKVAEELGVRYVLQGSARQIGEQVRINAQLVDATAGITLWADRTDRPIAEIFDVQDELVKGILGELEIDLLSDVSSIMARGQTDNIDARIAFQRGWESLNHFSASENAMAVKQFERAIEFDPNYGLAYAALWRAYFNAAEMYWHDELGLRRRDAATRARAIREKARQYQTPMVHIIQAQDDLVTNKSATALSEATIAITQSPNDPAANQIMADALIANNKPNAALSFLEKSIRLDPYFAGHYRLSYGIALFLMGDLNASISTFEQVLNENVYSTKTRVFLAASYARNSQRDKAKNILRQWSPGTEDANLFDKIFELPVYFWPGSSELRTNLRDGALLAALPLEITLDTLIEQLHQEEASDRADTARTIGLFGQNAGEAVQALIAALNDPVPIVRKEAVIALGKVGTNAREALPALEAIDHPPLIARHAHEAIKKIMTK